MEPEGGVVRPNWDSSERADALEPLLDGSGIIAQCHSLHGRGRTRANKAIPVMGFHIGSHGEL
jgi:hypothetical protein